MERHMQPLQSSYQIIFGAFYISVRPLPPPEPPPPLQKDFVQK